MRVTPVSAEKANEGGVFTPWKPGIYDFAVFEALEEFSKSGNEQIKLTLHVFDPDGKRRTVYDYLGAAENMQWKVRHFCESIGLTADYEGGDLDTVRMIERAGKLNLIVKAASGNYQSGNSVKDYIPRIEGAAAPAQRTTAPRPASNNKASPNDLNDDIPF